MTTSRIDASMRPRLGVISQSAKRLTFETFNAGQQAGLPHPRIEVRVDVDALARGEPEYEVRLKIEVCSTAGSETVYALDLLYAGVFVIENIPPDDLQPFLLIECPRILFPYAREIAGAAIRAGGFPNLLIDPIDFVDLYRYNQSTGIENGAEP